MVVPNKRYSGIMLIVVSTLLLIEFTGCTKNPTAVNREVAARPRVEQLALTTAMEDAYANVDFSIVGGKKVFIETKALAKTDVAFITSYVQKQVLSAGGIPVLDFESAEMKLTSTVDVSGTDEVKRFVGKDVVMGQFKGTMAVVDLAENAVVKIFELDSLAQTKRNRRAKTKVLD